jgi:DNA-binding PadR family transcriptional regulator
MKILSKPEELILLAVRKLNEDAYGVSIRKHVIRHTGQEWTVGAIYVPLGRLVKLGLLETTIGDPTPERGGKRKKFYKITGEGLKALAHIKKVNESMWSDVTDIELERGI